MKLYKVLFVIFSLIAFTACSDKKQQTQSDFIEITHEGVEEKPISTLFIGSTNAVIEVKGDYAIINDKKYGPLQDSEKLKLSGNFFSQILIKESTFDKMITFIRRYPLFFKGDGSSKDVNYTIRTNEQAQNLSNNGTRPFFNEMIKFLKSEGCDEQDVKQVGGYFNENLIAQ